MQVDKLPHYLHDIDQYEVQNQRRAVTELHLLIYLMSIPNKSHSMGCRSIMPASLDHGYKIPCCPSNRWPTMIFSRKLVWYSRGKRIEMKNKKYISNFCCKYLLEGRLPDKQIKLLQAAVIGRKKCLQKIHNLEKLLFFPVKFSRRNLK